jgi:hypothetical protein
MGLLRAQQNALDSAETEERSGSKPEKLVWKLQKKDHPVASRAIRFQKKRITRDENMVSTRGQGTALRGIDSHSNPSRFLNYRSIQRQDRLVF